MKELPRGWIAASLSDFCHIKMGQAPPSSTYNYCGKGLPFLQGKSEFGSIYPVPRKFCSSPLKIANSGDVLLSVRAPVGPTNIAKQKCCIGRGLAAIFPLGGVSNRFLLWALRLHELELGNSGVGSTFNAITKEQVVSIPINLPPLNEQYQIVEKIEALFEEIDQGIESLRIAKFTLDQYRKSLLKSAFEGRLTTDWRAQNPDKLANPNILLTRIREEGRHTTRIPLKTGSDPLLTGDKVGRRAEGQRSRSDHELFPLNRSTLEL